MFNNTVIKLLPHSSKFSLQYLLCNNGLGCLHLPLHISIILSFVSRTKCCWRDITRVCDPLLLGPVCYVLFFLCNAEQCVTCTGVWGHPMVLCPRCVPTVHSFSEVSLWGSHSCDPPDGGNAEAKPGLTEVRLPALKAQLPALAHLYPEGCFLWLSQRRHHPLQVCGHSGALIPFLIPAGLPVLAHLCTRGLFLAR